MSAKVYIILICENTKNYFGLEEPVIILDTFIYIKR